MPWDKIEIQHTKLTVYNKAVIIWKVKALNTYIKKKQTNKK